MQLTNSSDLEVTIGYGQGGVVGNIDFAELKIGDFVVPSQGESALGVAPACAHEI